MMNKQLRADLAAHAEQQYPKECCGLIVKNADGKKYIPCANIKPESERKENGPEFGFIIDPKDYSAAEDEGDIIAIAHSHPDAGAFPSDQDLQACDDSNLPWVIVSWPDGEFYEWKPRTNRAYEGRHFVLGSSDCWTIIRDWYQKELGITLKNYSVEDEWWKSGQNLYMDNWQDEGFEEVGKEDIQRGDIIIMTIRAKVPNHGAVYLGDGKMLHHMYGRPSQIVDYSEYYRLNTNIVVRNKEMMNVK